MNSPESEVESHITNGNYEKAVEVSANWLASNTEQQEDTAEYHKAKESYVYSKFFLDRSERIQISSPGRERANVFIGYLEQLEKLRKKHHFHLMNSIWQVVFRMVHSEIAANLAKDMAGQKSYSLEENHIFQLVFSLIELQNFQGAQDALRFLYNMKPNNSLVNLLFAFVYGELGNLPQTEIFLREALFIDPDILKKHSRLIPGGAFRELWDEVELLGLEDEVKCRNFALLVESNGLYSEKRDANVQEIKK